MASDFPSKKELTKLFLEKAGMPTDDENVKKYLWAWWTNPISKTSLRLTEYGATFLVTALDIEQYEYKLTDEAGPFPSKLLILMDKYITVPFYLAQRKKIVFFGERDAIMLALHGNNLFSYLTSFT